MKKTKQKLTDRQQYALHLADERERRRLSSLALDEEREREMSQWLSQSERDARNEEAYKSWKNKK